MKKIMMIVLLSCAFTSVKAQLNFVLNGSFEQHSHCPNAFDQIKYAINWNSIDTSWSPGDSVTSSFPECYPEYENTCGYSGFCPPSTPWFYQHPRTGDALVQTVIYYDYGFTSLDQYNYLQGRFATHLVAGNSYCVTFFVSKANAVGYAVNKIGAYLDDGTIDTASRCAVPQTQYIPQILDTNIISDTLSWVKIQGNFVANGTEQFITIGDFFDTGNVRKIYVPGNNFGMYLIDDVSVILSDATAYAGLDTAIKQGDTAHIGAIANGDGMPCWWYVLGSTTPIDSGGTIKVHPAATTTYVVKMDLCGAITYDTVTVQVWPLSIGSQQLAVSSCRVYPNPATKEITVEGVKGCDVVLFDVVGRKIASYLTMTTKQALDISGLANGIYVVQFTNPLTGEKSTQKMIKQ